MVFISMLENCLLLVTIHISVSFSITHSLTHSHTNTLTLSLSLCTHTHTRTHSRMSMQCLTFNTYVREGVGAADSASQRKTIPVLLSTFPNVGFRVLEKASECFM